MITGICQNRARATYFFKAGDTFCAQAEKDVKALLENTAKPDSSANSAMTQVKIHIGRKLSLLWLEFANHFEERLAVENIREIQALAMQNVKPVESVRSDQDGGAAGGPKRDSKQTASDPQTQRQANGSNPFSTVPYDFCNIDLDTLETSHAITAAFSTTAMNGFNPFTTVRKLMSDDGGKTRVMDPKTLTPECTKEALVKVKRDSTRNAREKGKSSEKKSGRETQDKKDRKDGGPGQEREEKKVPCEFVYGDLASVLQSRHSKMIFMGTVAARTSGKKKEKTRKVELPSTEHLFAFRGPTNDIFVFKSVVGLYASYDSQRMLNKYRISRFNTFALKILSVMMGPFGSLDDSARTADPASFAKVFAVQFPLLDTIEGIAISGFRALLLDLFAISEKLHVANRHAEKATTFLNQFLLSSERRVLGKILGNGPCDGVPQITNLLERTWLKDTWQEAPEQNRSWAMLPENRARQEMSLTELDVFRILEEYLRNGAAYQQVYARIDEMPYTEVSVMLKSSTSQTKEKTIVPKPRWELPSSRLEVPLGALPFFGGLQFVDRVHSTMTEDMLFESAGSAGSGNSPQELVLSWANAF